MTIQHIDMAVPVGRAASDKRGNGQAAAEVAELEAFQARLTGLVSRTCSQSLRESRRIAQAREFDVEIRALIKKFVSSHTAQIADRNDRTNLRAQLYTDLLTLAQELRADVSEHQRRFAVLITRSLMALSFVVVSLASVLTVVIMG